jgi:hypothetical protein
MTGLVYKLESGQSGSRGNEVEGTFGEMGLLINFRAARKRAARLHKEERAAQNRVQYGRTKAERDLEAARSSKAAREFEAHRIEKDREREGR